MKFCPEDSTLFKGLDLATFDPDPGIQICDVNLLGHNVVAKKDPKVSVLVGENLEPEQVVGIMCGNRFQSFVQKNEAHFVEDLRSSAELLVTPKLYFVDGGRRILELVEREIEIKFSTTADKTDLKKQIGLFLGNALSQNVLESSEAILEELYMNAIFDAPREAAKKGYVNCSYEMGIYSTIRIFQSAKRLVITCEDPFGSLDTQKFIKRMDEVYKKGAGEAINLHGDGGAGLGCVILFEHCESLFLGVIPGQKTLVSCIIPLGMSYKQRAHMKKSLHLINTKI